MQNVFGKFCHWELQFKKNLSAIWLLIKSWGCFWQQSIPVNEKQSPVSSPIGNGNKKIETQQEINMEGYGNIL